MKYLLSAKDLSRAEAIALLDLAEEMGITLVGFLRGERCNIYTHHHRISSAS